MSRHVEAQVQSAVVTYLATNNWQVQSVADTAARSHGIDIVAVKDGITIGVEVERIPQQAILRSKPCSRDQAHTAGYSSSGLVR